jgi:outer membrane murein-binding lipoprotein Lpp
MSTRRIVSMIFGSVVLTLLLVGAGVGSYFVYDNKASEVSRLERKANNLSADLWVANRAARDAQREADRSYRSGYRAAFGGLSWAIGEWYAVHVGAGASPAPFRLTYRAHLERCRLFTIRQGHVQHYVGGLYAQATC